MFYVLLPEDYRQCGFNPRQNLSGPHHICSDFPLLMMLLTLERRLTMIVKVIAM